MSAIPTKQARRVAGALQSPTRLRLVRSAHDAPLSSVPSKSPVQEVRAPYEFGTWYKRFETLVARMVHQRIHDYQKAEDVISQAWMKISRAGPSYNPLRAKEVTFVMMITGRVIVDHLRREKSAAQTNGNQLGEADAWLEPSMIRRGSSALREAANGGERALQDERLKRIVGLLEQIEPFKRSILERCYLRGRSLRQIAEEDNIPLGTIKSALSRALVQLREAAKHQISNN